MITIIKKDADSKNGNKPILEVRGLSTDEKPIEGVSNGSIYLEIDTGKMYLYDLENEEWKEV